MKFIDRCRYGIRRRLAKTVNVREGGEQYSFYCESEVEAYRAITLFVKEAGTVQWIRDSVREGDTFYDIGANIGLYTLLAAARVGTTGQVYAFEPHAANVTSLLRNIGINNAAARVKTISSALHEADGYFQFNYRSWQSGSSTSQLGTDLDEQDHRFTPLGSELKNAVTVDRLVADAVIRPPDLIKIDVDGNELPVLRGMRKVLAGSQRPREVQVEVNIRYKTQLFHFMRELGFELSQRHYTMAGKSQLAKGLDPESVPYNALFKAAH